MHEGFYRPTRILLNNQWGRLCSGHWKQSPKLRSGFTTRNAVAWIARKKRTQ